VTELAGWGRVPVVRGDERLSEDLKTVCRGAVLTRGLGRSYGDASLPAQEGAAVAGTRFGNRLLAFDEVTGVLRAEAGLSLVQLEAFCRPKGWVSPVCPGTQWVTVGGMVASDVHGKNHHVAGTFGEHVRALRMLLADGRVFELSPDCEDPAERELFAATLGGMGLTGHILEVEVQLSRVESAWIHTEEEIATGLADLVTRLRRASAEWPYTVAWVDSLTRGAHMGRGVVMKGRWATASEAPARAPEVKRRVPVPIELPGWVLGPLTVRAFDSVFYRSHAWRPKHGIVHPETFFYPLDTLLHWNRLYGKQGFVQHQCVLPVDDGEEVVHRFFDTLTRFAGASFLTVMKDCGPEGSGMISFPRPGLSVALDIPMRGERTQALVDALNEHVLSVGGRVYLAKDALTRPEHFRAMEPRLDAWNAIRRRWDPDGLLKSALSVRLLGDVR